MSLTYIHHTKKGNDKTSVWFYFLQQQGSSSETAKCKQCQKIIKTAGGSTKGLHTHLKSVHNVDLLKKSASETEAGGPSTSSAEDGPKLKKKTKTIKEYFITSKTDISLPAILARMTARDGFPFRVFCTSVDLREALRARGFTDLPTSPNTIKNMVMRYCKNVRSTIIQEMEAQKGKGHKFSLTFDEWTSIRNKRYMNVNVHGNAGLFWSLGLIRIFGSMPAEKCIELLEERLKRHQLSLTNDIVAITTDGASVMTKVGRLIKAEQQLCFAHGVQLGVIDVLYKKPPNNADMPDGDNFDSGSGSGSDDEDDVGLSISDDGFSPNTHWQLSDDVLPLIKKVRKVVHMFRRSPTKNDILQNYVRQEFGKELNLLSDTKTRWNSLLFMLERVLKIKSALLKALIDVSNIEMSERLTDEDFTKIEEIVYALQPVNLAVEALCRRDTNLISADAALEFMIQTLQSQTSDISKNLAKSLLERIQKRRSHMSAVLQFLHTGPTDKQDSKIFATTANAASATVRNTVRTLIERLTTSAEAADEEYETEMECQELPAAADPVSRANTSGDLSMREKFDLAIKNSMTSPDRSASIPKNLLSTIKTEMTLFEQGGNRGRHLQKVYDFLLTVTPTSVEAERAFSTAGSLCTKTRSSLRDEVLDELTFLRTYFRSSAP